MILLELSIVKGFLERVHGLKFHSHLFKNKEKDTSRSQYTSSLA